MMKGLPLITVYDDNHFVRNDYDVLSFGQRNYVINYFARLGFKQSSGQLLEKSEQHIHIPKPNANLAISSFESHFLKSTRNTYYCVTPTMFAETLFYQTLGKPYLDVLKTVRKLIKKCRYNIEWLRDISYRSPIEDITKSTYDDLVQYQKFIVTQRFKSKKAL